MPAGGIASGLIGGLFGIGEAIWGNSEKNKYQSQINALNSQRPTYSINPEEYDIQNLAESRASQGMDASAKNALQSNADRNLATLSNAALMGGADANSIGNIADKVQNAYNQNAIYDDQVHMQNLSNLQNAWARMSSNRDKQWQINQYQPWKDKMTALSQQLAGANNMFMSGLNMAGGGFMSMGKNLFGGGGSGGGGDTGGGSGGGSDMSMNSGGGGGYGGGYAGGSDMGGNLGMGGYSPIMLGSGMGGPSPDSPTDHESVFLANNTNSPWS